MITIDDGIKNLRSPSGDFGFMVMLQESCSMGSGQTSCSEQFQLLHDMRKLGILSAPEKLHRGKLPVSYAHYPDIPIIRKQTLDSADVHIGILHRRALPQIDGKLKHGEPIAQKLLAKLGGTPALLLRLCRQIKEHKHPHDTIFA
jgi:hypothetical protein